MLEYIIERLETLSSSYYFQVQSNSRLTHLCLLDEHLREIADLSAQAFAESV